MTEELILMIIGKLFIESDYCSMEEQRTITLENAVEIIKEIMKENDNK